MRQEFKLLSVNLPKVIHEELIKYCYENHTKKSDVAKRLIIDFLNKSKEDAIK
jgi:hypothetical protein